MEADRYPRIFYSKLLEADGRLPYGHKYNWVTLLRGTTSELGLGNMWEQQNTRTIRENIPLIETYLIDRTFLEDCCRVGNSTYNPLCREIANLETREPKKYLIMSLPMTIIKVIAQRSGRNEINCGFKRFWYKITENVTYTVCNL